MFLTQAQSVIKVLVIMCMFSGLIRIEMFKQNRIISLISSTICLNLPESITSAYLLLTSQPSNYVELNFPTSSTKNFLLWYSDCLVFLQDTMPYS